MQLHLTKLNNIGAEKVLIPDFDSYDEFESFVRNNHKRHYNLGNGNIDYVVYDYAELCEPINDSQLISHGILLYNSEFENDDDEVILSLKEAWDIYLSTKTLSPQ